MNKLSFRASLRAFSVLGGAQFVNLLANIIKMKVAALLLGPTGVGLIGLYSSLFQTSASLAAFGLDGAGPRQLAAAASGGGELAVGRIRRAIFWCGLALALIGGGLFYLSSHLIATIVVDDQARQDDVAWLSIGVVLTVFAVSGTAILTGLRRVGDLARINVGVSIVGTIISIVALRLWGEYAIVLVVLIAPALSVFFTYVFVARLGRTPGPRMRPMKLVSEMSPLLRIGVYAMSGVVLLQLGFLVVRAQVQRELGGEALGHFQAAWAIGVAYQALVLASMASDYFPRLTAVIKDRLEAARLINEQTELGLLICLPFILALLGFAPWVIQLFYSSEFSPAVEILRWQLLGDLFKMVFFPLGYALFAAGSVRLWSFNQLLSVVVLVVGVSVGISKFGLPATGIAYLLMYLVIVPLSWWPVRARMNFRFSYAVRWQMVISLTTAVAVAIAGSVSDVLGAVCGAASAIVVGAWALVRISMVADADGRLGRLAGVGTWAARRIRRRDSQYK